jgi:hypothetical protein
LRCLASGSKAVVSLTVNSILLPKLIEGGQCQQQRPRARKRIQKRGKSNNHRRRKNPQHLSARQKILVSLAVKSRFR